MGAASGLDVSWLRKLYDPASALAAYRDRSSRLLAKATTGAPTPADARRLGKRWADGERVSAQSLRARMAGCSFALCGTFCVLALLLVSQLVAPVRALLAADPRAGLAAGLLALAPWAASVALHVRADHREARFEQDFAEWVA